MQWYIKIDDGTNFIAVKDGITFFTDFYAVRFSLIRIIVSAALQM